MLPGMNGVQLAIKLGEQFPAIKTILLSGQAGTASLLDDAKAKGYDFEIVAKPVHPRELIECINKRLNR
jgi:FixJ family two-component response regulator